MFLLNPNQNISVCVFPCIADCKNVFEKFAFFFITRKWILFAFEIKRFTFTTM